MPRGKICAIAALCALVILSSCDSTHKLQGPCTTKTVIYRDSLNITVDSVVAALDTLACPR